MTGVGCLAHPEPGGHSELLATKGKSSMTSCPSKTPFLQLPMQMALQSCCMYCGPVQNEVVVNTALSTWHPLSHPLVT